MYRAGQPTDVIQQIYTISTISNSISMYRAGESIYLPQHPIRVFELVFWSIDENVVRDHVVSSLRHVHASSATVDVVVFEEVPRASARGARASLDFIGSEVQPVRSCMRT